MKQLFWKEWYELRLLPLASAVCVAVLIFGAKAFNRAYERTYPHFTLNDTLPPLLATWMIFAVLAGAALIAQEVGSGGLDFLSGLPTSRRRIWWVKVATAGAMVLLSALSSVLVWMVIDIALFRADFFSVPLGQMLPGAGVALLILFGSFAVALGVSPFLDRPISAVVAASLVAAVYYSVLRSLVEQYVGFYAQRYNWQPSDPHTRDGEGLFMIFVALSVPLFAAVSYWTFTRGETMRSSRRFRVGAVTGAIGLALVGLMFFTGSKLLLW